MAERWTVFVEGEPGCLHPRVQSRLITDRQVAVGRPYEARVCLDCRRELRRPLNLHKVTMPKAG